MVVIIFETTELFDRALINRFLLLLFIIVTNDFVRGRELYLLSKWVSILAPYLLVVGPLRKKNFF